MNHQQIALLLLEMEECVLAAVESAQRGGGTDDVIKRKKRVEPGHDRRRSAGGAGVGGVGRGTFLPVSARRRCLGRAGRVGGCLVGTGRLLALLVNVFAERIQNVVRIASIISGILASFEKPQERNASVSMSRNSARAFSDP